MNTIQIRIVKEFLKGKFYFRKSEVDYNLLPNKLPMEVNLFLGKFSSKSIKAILIDSGKGNPRINKSELIKWFSDEKLEIGQSFNVDIIDKKTFRLYK
jgi:hypothetical protein